MGIKNKTLGLILIILSLWPFLLKIEKINAFFSSYKFLTAITPGEIIYQIIIIAIGILLIWSVKPRLQYRR